MAKARRHTVTQQSSGESEMFRTISVRSLESTQGSHILVAQAHKTDPSISRYAILDSVTLQPVRTFTGNGARDQFHAEIEKIHAEWSAGEGATQQAETQSPQE